MKSETRNARAKQVHKNNLKRYHARGVETPMPDSQIDPIRTPRAYNKKNGTVESGLSSSSDANSSSNTNNEESSEDESVHQATTTTPAEVPQRAKRKYHKKVNNATTTTTRSGRVSKKPAY